MNARWPASGTPTAQASTPRATSTSRSVALATTPPAGTERFERPQLAVNECGHDRAGSSLGAAARRSNCSSRPASAPGRGRPSDAGGARSRAASMWIRASACPGDCPRSPLGRPRHPSREETLAGSGRGRRRDRHPRAPRTRGLPATPTRPPACVRHVASMDAAARASRPSRAWAAATPTPLRAATPAKGSDGGPSCTRPTLRARIGWS